MRVILPRPRSKKQTALSSRSPTSLVLMPILPAASESISPIAWMIPASTQRAASEGRNPRTGDKIAIPASKQPKFKPGKGLKDSVN